MVWTTEPLLLTHMLYCGSVLFHCRGLLLSRLSENTAGGWFFSVHHRLPSPKRYTLHRGAQVPKCSFSLLWLCSSTWWLRALFWGQFQPFSSGHWIIVQGSVSMRLSNVLFPKSYLFKNLIKKVTLLFSLWSPYFKLFFFLIKKKIPWVNAKSKTTFRFSSALSHFFGIS